MKGQSDIEILKLHLQLALNVVTRAEDLGKLTVEPMDQNKSNTFLFDLFYNDFFLYR
jgi:hypothetical protein